MASSAQHREYHLGARLGASPSIPVSCKRLELGFPGVRVTLVLGKLGGCSGFGGEIAGPRGGPGSGGLGESRPGIGPLPRIDDDRAVIPADRQRDPVAQHIEASTLSFSDGTAHAAGEQITQAR